MYKDIKIKNKKYTKINNTKRKSSYIESKLCTKVTITLHSESRVGPYEHSKSLNSGQLSA